MKPLLKPLAFIIIFCSVMNAQQLGLTIEAVAPETDRDLDEGAGVSLTAAYGVLPGFDIEGKTGYAVTLKYLGWDLYLGVKYKILDPVYITGGILSHFNDGWHSIHEGTVSKNITMPGLGGGVSFSSVFSLELTYYWLLKPEYWYSYRDFLDEVHKEYLNNVIKLNFKFLWNL